jgi:hypothetical protein
MLSDYLENNQGGGLLDAIKGTKGKAGLGGECCMFVTLDLHITSISVEVNCVG